MSKHVLLAIMKTKDAIEYFGSPSALAKALDINRQAIASWKEYPPVGRQYQLQVITGGKLKAEQKAA